MIMLSLLGMGPHGKECATPLNYSQEGVSMSLPPKIKETKESRNLNKLDPNRFCHPQSNKETTS